MVETKKGRWQDMGDTTNGAADFCALVAEQKLPRWEELPDLELYMDQVLSLMERYLGSYPGFDRKGLTASMVNNYVKLGVMPPPVKKKYTRIHLAHLIMICVLKASLPIDQIKNLILKSVENAQESEIYNKFCEDFEASVRQAADAVSADPGIVTIYRAALRAQAEQALSRKLYEELFRASMG